MKKPEPEPPILLSGKQAAKLLNITDRHLFNLTRQGLFKRVKLGASSRYLRADIEAVIAKLAEGDGQ
jgi:predicted DNA-binding transcriptional regulator AlpA